MMTKKDFKKVAEILDKNICTENRYNKEEPFLFYVDNLINDFIEWFKSENPLFDEKKFREAVLK